MRKPTKRPPAKLPRTRKASAPPKPSKTAKPRKPGAAPKPPKAATPRILSGGNPQIAKGEGEGPVRAYIAAIPVRWKRETVRRLDALIAAAVPGVRKAVKWNSPFYRSGPKEEGWFLSLHCYANFVRVAFFRGGALKPSPPGPSKWPEVRYLDVREGELDAAQFTDWVRQASGM